MRITDSYYQARRDAIVWLNGKREFEPGVNILIASGYKPIVAAKLKKTGDRPHTREKLVYEIRQMIQVWANPDDPKYDDVDFEASESVGVSEAISERDALVLLTEADSEISKECDENQLPPVIQKVIYEFSDCYKSRSILHKQMGELPEDNGAAIVQKRKTIVQAIAALSSRMKILHDIRKRYETSGVLPTDQELAEGFADPDEDTGNDDDSIEVVLPKTLDELKKLRKNEATKLTRARNMLLFQTETKPKPPVEDPLPDCPKRVKLEKKIIKLEDLISKVDYKIAELS